MGKRHSRRTTALALISATLFGLGCNGGGCGSGSYTFPQERVQERIARAKLTRAGLDFIRARLPDLLKAVLGADQNGRIRVPIASSSDPVYTLSVIGFDLVDLYLQDDPNVSGTDAGWAAIGLPAGSSIDVNLIDGTPPKLKITLQNVQVDAEVRLFADWGLGDAACYARGGLDRGTPNQRALKLSLDIEATLGIDANGNLDTTVTIPTLTIIDFDVNIDPAPRSDRDCDDGIYSGECEDLCGASDFLVGAAEFLRDLLSGFIDDLLRSLLPGVIEGFLDGIPLKLETQVSLKDLAGDLFAQAQPLGLLLDPSAAGFQFDGVGDARGLKLDLNGGAESSPSNPCVPPLDPLPTFTAGPFPDLTGVDSQGRVYHLGLSLSEAFLNQAGVALYTSGSLCISVTSADIAELSGFGLDAGALGLLVPGLRELVEPKAPVLIQVAPTQPPEIKLGTGELMAQTRDSLIQLKLNGFTISFYALIEGRFARLFSFATDIFVGLSLTILPDNRIQITVDRVDIDKLTQLYNEIFQGTDLQAALQFLVELATDAVLGQGIDFAFDITNSLPGPLQGQIGLQINEIIRDGANNDFLTVALTLLDTSQGGGAMGFRARTRASLAPELPPMAVGADGRRFATGRIGIDVAGAGRRGDASDLEYQVRLDRGAWTSFRPGPRIVLTTPRLKVIGDHEVQVRARVRGAPRSLDPEPVRIPFVVDPVPPRLWLLRGGDTVYLEAEDERTPREQLEFSWRVDGASWTTFGRAATLALADLPTGDLLEVRARDAVGNVSAPEQTRISKSHGRTTGTPEGCGSTGCASGGRGGGLGLALLLGALLAASWWRRRRRARTLLGIFLGLALLGVLPSCGDSAGNTCTSDTQCPTGFRCRNNTCQPIGRCDSPTNPEPCCPGQICSAAGTCVDVIPRCNPDGTCDKPGQTCSSTSDGGSSGDGICTYQTCTTDAQCSGGASCFNGFCREPSPCSGGCASGQVCVTPTDECYPAPPGCASVSCGAGQILVFDNVASQVGGTCDLAAATCSCADIPEISPGDWGRDSRVAVKPGGLPVVSAYDKTYGDVVLASFDTSGALTKLEYVDGVPAGATPVGRPSGRRGGIAEPGPNVGRYTSVVLDGTGNPMIAYYDLDNADLKFAAWNAGASRWDTHVVDSQGDQGRYAHLVLAPNGRPAIAYLQLDSGVNNNLVGLKFAQANTTTPASASDWTVMEVDFVTPPPPPGAPCGGACVSPQVCVAANGADGGADECVTPDQPAACSPACASAQVCAGGVCRDEVAPPPTFDDLPEAVGLFPSLAFNNSGVPHIAYYDRINGNLKGARASSATPAAPTDWQKAVIDGAAGSPVDGDVGLFPSLQFTGDGKMAIAYEDATNDDLAFYLGTDFSGGVREVVDAGTANVPLSLVGADASLAIAGDGTIYIAYQDATLNDLKLAKRTGAGQWERSTVLSDGAWGFFADLAIAEGKLFISNLRLGFDLNARPVNELKVVIQPLP